jgi:hypothetical protein
MIELRQFLGRRRGRGFGGLLMMRATSEQHAQERKGRYAANALCGRAGLEGGGQDCGPLGPDWEAVPAFDCESG